MSNSTPKMKNETPLLTFPSRPSLRKHAVYCILALVSLLGLGITQSAKASFIATINQVGTDVVVNGSGTIDLFALTSIGSFTGVSGMVPQNADIGIGSPLGQAITGYTGISGPSSYGSGPGKIPSDSGSGDKVNLVGASLRLFVPAGYLTGTLLSDTSTYNNRNFANLGINPGTYTWTWGTGTPHADSFTLQIGSVPDAGSTLSLLGFASLGLVALRRKLRC
jgi:VPDSG-CTERM motif